MKLAQSRLTSQGQVSVPAEVRRRLGLSPGSVLEWEADGEHIVVRRSQKHSSADVHATLFPDGVAAAHSLQDLKEGIRRDLARRHARR
ncbi:MAG: AbrB/MazE/SpoVT family DNA-binding domain-containing protein [Gemmatimonadaceae bacterium]|nr:AbrB/MazE/SpoVT family DNA-binding domain-containing protein [Gemmatimonadaceae bacterium]